jgi:transcriptional regulator of acetoin/glycerol metabolism
MSRHAGNISAASREAGIDRNYLYRLLKKHGLG